MTTKTHDTDRIEEEARDWLVYLHSDAVDDEGLHRFEVWIGQDEAHAAAYTQVEQIMGDLTLVSELGEIDISHALVSERPSLSARMASAVRARPLVSAGGLAAAAIVLIMFFTQISLFDFSPRHQVFATHVAEIRDVTLPDGSTVTLGARSRIETDFGADTRRVILTQGEAFFSVTRDETRPFYVTAGDTLVRVVGTQFDVRHGPDQVRVSVLEGVVDVMRAAEIVEELSVPAPQVRTQRVTAGQQVVASRGGTIAAVRQVEPGHPGAWRRGWLVYENASLGEVIADANRYYTQEIILESDDLRALRITTAFGADKIDQLIAGLVATHPIKADKAVPGRVVLRSEP